MQLIPYLSFNGNCEEALNFYSACFDGKIEFLQRYDKAPMEVSEEHKNKVLHALFRFGENSLMASDIFPGSTVSSGSSISLSINLKDENQSRKIFEKLSDGGNITMPMEKQFWGALFGQLTDKYGISWMINCELDGSNP